MLKLTQTAWGEFDLVADGAALAGDDAAAATIVYAALFTDAQAPASRVPDMWDRQGWWANPAAGSGLWHVRRQALGSAARREAVGLVRLALESHGLKNVSVQEQSGAGNVSSVVLNISGFHNGHKFLLDIPL